LSEKHRTGRGFGENFSLYLAPNELRLMTSR